MNNQDNLSKDFNNLKIQANIQDSDKVADEVTDKITQDFVYIRPIDICVRCGAPAPEGRMLCWCCEHNL